MSEECELTDAETTKATLRKLIEDAASDVDTYKHHDPVEARDWINKLLAAGKLGGIGSDRIEYIRFRRLGIPPSGVRMVEVGTSYSVRQCAQTAEHSFPEHVLDADDPVEAIKTWAWGERVAEAESKLKSARIDLERAEAAYHEALAS